MQIYSAPESVLLLTYTTNIYNKDSNTASYIYLEWNRKNKQKLNRIISTWSVVFETYTLSCFYSGCQNGAVYVWTLPQGGAVVSLPNILGSSPSQEKNSDVKVCFGSSSIRHFS